MKEREQFLILINIQLGPEDPRTKDSDLWLRELTQNAVAVAQQAREEQARNAAGATKTTPMAAAGSAASAAGPAASAAVPEVPRGELPIDQVLQYINGEPTTAARKGKKSQKKRK